MNNSKTFDLSRLRLRGLPSRSPSPPRTRPPRPGRGEQFLKGPIPWVWLTKAMALPGKALHVGIALWFRAGIERTGTIRLSLTRLRSTGLSRSSACRGLRALEKADLINVERHMGRAPIVTLIVPRSLTDDGSTRHHPSPGISPDETPGDVQSADEKVPANNDPRNHRTEGIPERDAADESRKTGDDFFPNHDARRARMEADAPAEPGRYDLPGQAPRKRKLPSWRSEPGPRPPFVSLREQGRPITWRR